MTWNREAELCLQAPPHPMMLALKSRNCDDFVLDVIRRIRSRSLLRIDFWSVTSCAFSELERSLLLVPFTDALDVLSALRLCIQARYHIEVACRVVFFLTRSIGPSHHSWRLTAGMICRIHHNQLINAPQGAELIAQLAEGVPQPVAAAKVSSFELPPAYFGECWES